jgi:hypothetical protein
VHDYRITEPVADLAGVVEALGEYFSEVPGVAEREFDRDVRCFLVAAHAPKARPPILLRDCGHWIQQERPGEVNAALLEFLSGL